ncbi:MAG TPA: flagellar assembly protein FliW [Polyangiaceae bacterium]
MNIQSRRFGSIEIDEENVLTFPQGIIGFPEESKFVLVPHNAGGFLAWLQSARSPDMALPVVSAHAFGDKYPDVPVEPAAHAAGLGPNLDDMAVLVVLCAPTGQPATVNLLAPIVVNVATRSGAQVILDGSRFTTRELFIRPPEPVEAPKTQAAAE